MAHHAAYHHTTIPNQPQPFKTVAGQPYTSLHICSRIGLAERQKPNLLLRQAHDHTTELRKMKRLLNAAPRQMLNGSRPLITPGKVSEQMTLPAASFPTMLRPPYADTGVDPKAHSRASTVRLGGKAHRSMETACKHAADLLQFAGSLVKPGVTTDEIDRRVFEYITSKNIYPSPLNYMGFPKSLCTSINEVLCHGVPDDRELVEGDIINLDVSTYVEGFHGDTSSTFQVGQVSETAERLCKATEDALQECIDRMGPGVPLSLVAEICSARSIAEGFEVSDTFCGHGIGQTFHMAPLVFHCKGVTQEEILLKVGQVFTIEPIFCEGSCDFYGFDDGWTVSTVDGGLTAQYEHTLIITDNGAEIMTRV